MFGYFMVPSADAGYEAFVINSCRGYYNSAWIGVIYGILSSTIFSLFGFYFIKGSIISDYETHFGLIIASNPITKPTYLMGKFISNLTFFSIILFILTIIAFLMQLLRAESSSYQLIELIAYLWLISFPTLAIVSALAIFFESIPFLRQSFGNVLYFAIWISAILIFIGRLFGTSVDIEPQNDVFGLSRIVISIRDQLMTQHGEIQNGVSDLFVPKGEQEISVFEWTGIKWTLNMFFERILWIGISILMVFCAAVPFDRFDPSHYINKDRKKKAKSTLFKDAQREPSYNPIEIKTKLKPTVINFIHTPNNLKQYPNRIRWWASIKSILRIMFIELYLISKEQRWWWFMVTFILFISSFIVSKEELVRQVLPLCWLWPISIWSGLGNKEVKYHTEKIIFSISAISTRQLIALYGVGIVISMITGSGAGLRFIFEADWNSLYAWLISATFIPSLSICLVVLSKKSVVFDIVYIILWIIGPLIGLPFRSIIERGDGFNFKGITILYLCISIMLFYLAYFRRQNQLIV